MKRLKSFLVVMGRATLMCVFAERAILQERTLGVQIPLYQLTNEL
jgi:hypothetical protein